MSVWRTRARRAKAGIALAALIAATSCSTRTLVEGLPADEAQRCVVVLKAAGIDAAAERDASGAQGTFLLTVRGDDAAYRSALQLLDEHGLPRLRREGFGAQSDGLIPSPSEERARYIKGLSSEIEGLIESIDGVVEADVLVSLPERRPLAAPGAEAASASAVVSHAGEESPVSEAEVRAIVVRAVGTAIAEDGVAVLLKPVVRGNQGPPIVRYERDRATELGFLAAVAALAALQAATVWRLRAQRRLEAREGRDGDGE
jgi:type III secretion protein J